MKIGIVLHPYGEKNPAGLARAILELTKALIHEHPEHEYTIFLKGAKGRVPKFSKTVRTIFLGNGLFWLERLRRHPVDVCLFNTPVLPLFSKPKKTVVIAHDFAYLLFQESSLRTRIRRAFTKRYHAYSLRRADAIITPSAHARDEMQRYFDIDIRKASVVHWGFKKICSVSDGFTSDAVHRLPQPYFLFVGVLKERKNVHRVIEAYCIVAHAYPDFHLVIVGNGAGAYYDRLRRLSHESGFTERIHFLGFVHESDLPALYARAFAFVFPSLVEGFGFPVLEAMQCGVPVITSRGTSLPEVAADAALLADPYTADAIASAMMELIQRPVVHKEFITRGREHAERFSWQKAERKVHDIMSRLI